MRCDMMPFLAGPSVDRAEQERLERGLMYVAMIRAEEILAFTRSTSNGFASRMQQLLDIPGNRTGRFVPMDEIAAAIARCAGHPIEAWENIRRRVASLCAANR